MQARRGTALLLSCLLGLVLFPLSASPASAQHKHAPRAVATLAPAGSEAPHSWRSAPDNAATVHAHRIAGAALPAADPVRARSVLSSDARTPQVRGPPGSASH
jgi:hypothetical protein